MNNEFQITCYRCKGKFRERAGRVMRGYTRQCPSCEAVMIFDDQSQQLEIKAAIKRAREIRAALKEEAENVVRKPTFDRFRRPGTSV
jgi:uncharacterized Zn finger protein (UPF0148 family)